MLPSDAIRQAEGASHPPSDSKPNATVAYRGTLMGQFRKGHFKEPPSIPEPLESGKHARQLEPAIFSMGKKEIRNGLRAGPTAWKSTGSSRLIDNSLAKTRPRRARESVIRQKKPTYHSSKVQAIARASLGPEDLVAAYNIQDPGKQPYITGGDAERESCEEDAPGRASPLPMFVPAHHASTGHSYVPVL